MVNILIAKPTGGTGETLLATNLAGYFAGLPDWVIKVTGNGT